MNSFCAMYSLRMSFWVVPESLSNGMPRFSALTRYIAQIMAAGLLMVIDVVISSSGMPSKSTSMSARDETRRDPHAAGAELTFGPGIVGVVAVQGGHVVGN